MTIRDTEPSPIPPRAADNCDQQARRYSPWSAVGHLHPVSSAGRPLPLRMADQERVVIGIGACPPQGSDVASAAPLIGTMRTAIASTGPLT